MSLHLSVIPYSQKIDYAPITNCSESHQVQIKTKKVMEGVGRRAKSAPLGPDRVNTRDCNLFRSSSKSGNPAMTHVYDV